MEHAPHELLSMLVRQMNGLPNPMYVPRKPARHSMTPSSCWHAWKTPDRRPGRRLATKDGAAFALVIHDYAPANRNVVRELLKLWGLPASLAGGNADIVLP